MSDNHKHKSCCEHEGLEDLEIGCTCGHDHGKSKNGGCKDDCCHEHEAIDDLEIGCSCGHDHGNKKEISEAERIKSGKFRFVNKVLLIRFATALTLLVSGIAIEHTIERIGEYISLGLCIGAYLIIGYDIIIKCLKNIMKGKIFDENFLMVVASIAAFIIGEYPEAVMVLLLYQVGEAFQDYAGDKSVNSIKSIVAIRPDTAGLYADGEIKEVSAKSVKIGEILIVRNGDRVPLDGVIIEGDTYMDTLALTGESVPRHIRAGEEALAGYINNGGAVKLKVTRAYMNTTATKIIETVGKISESKGKSERFVTKFAKYYTPIVVIAAFLIGLIPSLMTGDYDKWIKTAINFLVISCPCALVISVPMAYFGGIGIASKHGILIKGGSYIDDLAKARKIVFDKTRTLTNGIFKVSEASAGDPKDAELLKSLAASIESFSAHPIARAICEYSIGQPELVSEPQELPGKGIRALYEGTPAAIGSEILMKEMGVEAKEHPVGTAVHVAYGGRYIGYIVISDTVKEGSKAALSELKRMGIDTYMLTGDKKDAAHIAGDAMGMNRENIYYELLPNDKVAIIDEIMKNPSKIAGKTIFCGDGINDAPVIARADVGIAMGGAGADAAIEAADAVVMNDEPEQVVRAVKISRRTKTIVYENIAFSLLVKLVVMILSLTGFNYIWLAIFADVGVSILAVFNSLRMLINKKR